MSSSGRSLAEHAVRTNLIPELGEGRSVSANRGATVLANRCDRRGGKCEIVTASSISRIEKDQSRSQGLLSQLLSQLRIPAHVSKRYRSPAIRDRSRTPVKADLTLIVASWFLGRRPRDREPEDHGRRRVSRTCLQADLSTLGSTLFAQQQRLKFGADATVATARCFAFTGHPDMVSEPELRSNVR